MNSPALPPPSFSSAEYAAILALLAKHTSPVITLAPDKYRVIAVNDPQRQAVQ
jgi:hypothetical protein